MLEYHRVGNPNVHRFIRLGFYTYFVLRFRLSLILTGKVYAVVGSLENFMLILGVIFYSWFLWPFALSSIISLPSLPYFITVGLHAIPVTILLCVQYYFDEYM